MMKYYFLFLSIFSINILAAQHFQGGDGVGGASNEYSAAFAMPLDILSFTATAAAEGVLLEWTTANEVDTDYMTVERSQDGQQFDQLGTLRAAGYSTTRLDYDYVDEDPLAGQSVYRLTVTDFDGSITRSDLVSVKRAEGQAIDVYPNPVSRRTPTLKFSHHGELTAYLFDASGRQVWRQTVEGGQANLPATLPVGQYLLQLRGVSGRPVDSGRLVIGK